MALLAAAASRLDGLDLCMGSTTAAAADGAKRPMDLPKVGGTVDVGQLDENGNAEVGLCARSPDENDQHFTRAAVELVDREVGPVDRTRVHVLGMSGGASMAWRLGCESRSRDITGISPRVAAVAGTIAPSLRTCCCASPVVVALHGDAVVRSNSKILGLLCWKDATV